MTAKQYLSQLHRLDVQINHKQDELARLRSAAESVTVPSGDGFGGCAGNDKVGCIVARMADLDAEIDADIDRLVDTRHKIINQIHALEDDRYIQILYKRYVEYKRLEQISAEMCYSFDRLRHLHGHALQAFASRHTT